MALYRNEVKWLWRFGIGWPLFILVGLFVTGAFRPVSGSSFIDQYGHVAIVLGGTGVMVLPILVVMVRHARVLLKHGDEHWLIMIASDIGGTFGMLSIAGVWKLSGQNLNWINPFLLIAVLPVLSSTMALIGTFIGERIGVKVTRLVR